MNDKIKKLAEQIYGSVHYDDFKFAELIIKECAHFVGDKNSLAVKRLFEHFGVEE